MRIVQVQHQWGAAESVAGLPEDLSRAVYDRLQGYVGQDQRGGEHVDYLLVEGRVVRVNGFLDVDGTYWVYRLGVGHDPLASSA